MHADLGVLDPYKFFIGPRDSVYYYTILSWRGFGSLRKINELMHGYYAMASRYHFRLKSNVDSFYGLPLPDSERTVYEEVKVPLEYFWTGPEGFPLHRREDQVRFASQLKKVTRKKSIFAPFCHYILWRLSLFQSIIKFPEPLNTIDLANEFFKLYPDSPLAEKLSFEMFRYYAWYCKEKDEEKGRAVVREALKKYPDNLLGYEYLDVKRKGVRER